ncbi:hypothetical protein [Methylobacterium sp. WCS2018Hpa-22]|uniref:hypothetical protein n=1 Tax=Methylobacterium sp. WCS2018Hpa-22 TaxID=3073633 RepID=UPI00288A2BF4|nr:hypothetical protein [Methylobacterium sp. WCS2018Hpa-22]
MRQTSETNTGTITQITLSDRARAQVEKSHIERIIATGWKEVKGQMSCYEARAEYVRRLAR